MSLAERLRAARLAEESSHERRLSDAVATLPDAATPLPSAVDHRDVAACIPPPPAAPLLPFAAGRPAEPCLSCGCPSFWLSPQNHLRCLNCDPPPRAAFIRERIEVVALGPFAAWATRENVLANLGQLPPPAAAEQPQETEIDPDELYLVGPRYYDKNETTAWRSILVRPNSVRPPSAPAAVVLKQNSLSRRASRKAPIVQGEGLFDGSDLVTTGENDV